MTNTYQKSLDADSPRKFLLAAALPFVREAGRLPGVTRIALIGSLTTDKPDPKDIDLLITISDATDASKLDRLARQFQGRVSATARELYGAEVFLADPAGHYLGRLCKHRECPSQRQRFARHCGLRPHVKDDLDVITLEPLTIADPPLILWPDVAARVAVPSDVESTLLAMLRSSLVIREAMDPLPETMEQRQKAIAEFLAAEPMSVPDDPQNLRIELDKARDV